MSYESLTVNNVDTWTLTEAAHCENGYITES